MNDCDPRERRDVVAAYREGLGLIDVTAVCDEAGIRVVAGKERDAQAPTAAAAPQRRWWCRRAAEAERIGAAANAYLRRHAPLEAPSTAFDAGSLALVAAAVTRAAARHNVVLHSDQQIEEAAMAAVARIDCELKRLQQSGGLRSVNKSYRDYRLQTSARGDRVARYSDWMRQYRAELVRQLAANLRFV